MRDALALVVACALIAGCGGEAANAQRDPAADEAPRKASPSAAAGATDDGWPDQRNGPLKQGVATSDLPEKLELLWTKKIPFGIPATCAIAGGHVYVPTLEGHLYCLDTRTGDEVWKYRSIDDPDPKAFAPGFKAAPTVSADAVYSGDEDGLVHAVDRETGRKKWTFDTRGEVAGGPTLVGEKGESLLVGSHGGGLHRLRAADGEVEWTVGDIGPINLSPPVVGEKTIALGCETGALVTVEIATGKELARVPLAETTLATPAVHGDQLYLGMYDGRVLSIAHETGDVTWTFQPQRALEFHASCAVTDDAVYAAGRNKLLHRLDRATGAEVWNFATQAQINASPVVVGNRVFVASDDKHLYGVSVENGEKVFEYNLEETPAAGPAVGEGVLVIGTQDNPTGTLFCFGAK